MEWADAVRRMRVRANAETPLDARTARQFGAEGIGLCRTEHMFFEGERIIAVREMILADDEAGRRAALAKLLPMQRQDFAELFEIMHGLPVTIRLLDPPLHEFLPHTETDMAEVARSTGASVEKLKLRANELHEFNPMLGFRGVRLAVRYPEIAEMQARAIFEGAVQASKKAGTPVTAEIMVPLVMGRPEFDMVKKIIVAMAEMVAAETGVTVPYHVGTMIELPRAALRAGDIAESAEFFSFGTNDLTQTTLGLSRDDASSFLGSYTSKNLLPCDPFVTLDQEGVGELVKIAAERGRATRPDIKLGICGEHGGDPASIGFCETDPSRLCLVLAVPRADRSPRGGAGGARQVRSEPDGVRVTETAWRGSTTCVLPSTAATRVNQKWAPSSAPIELKRSVRLHGVEREALESLLAWFEANLPTPDRFSRTTSKGLSRRRSKGLSWFKPSAETAIRKMRELVEILSRYGYSVEELRTLRPGFVTYEDEHQIVAEPFAETPR